MVAEWVGGDAGSKRATVAPPVSLALGLLVHLRQCG